MMFSSAFKSLRKQLVVGLALSLMCQVTLGADITTQTLISSCRELIAIYDRKGQKQFLAGISTSAAEALRAGICRGMLEEHSRHDDCNAGWYEEALKIAGSKIDPEQDVEQLLETACR